MSNMTAAKCNGSLRCTSVVLLRPVPDAVFERLRGCWVEMMTGLGYATGMLGKDGWAAGIGLPGLQTSDDAQPLNSLQL